MPHLCRGLNRRGLISEGSADLQRDHRALAGAALVRPDDGAGAVRVEEGPQPDAPLRINVGQRQPGPEPCEGAGLDEAAPVGVLVIGVDLVDCQSIPQFQRPPGTS